MRHFDLTKIFKNDPKLHVLVWNRFDEKINKRAILLVKDYLDDSELGDYVLPMLYPLGRYQGDYEKTYGKLSDIYCSPDFHRKNLEPPNNRRTILAELCLQVSDKHEKQARNILVDWINDVKHGCTWSVSEKQDWRPMERPSQPDMQDCQYANATTDTGKKFLRDLPSEQVPWFLKLIWYRATEVICNQLVNSAHLDLIDPEVAEGKDRFRELLGETFQDIDVRKFGLTVNDKSGAVVQPWQFGVSHLAAIAFNGVTVFRSSEKWALEQYWNSRDVTRPCRFPSLEGYLDQFKSDRES